MKFYIAQHHRHHMAGFFARFNHMLEHFGRMEDLAQQENETLIPYVDYQSIVTFLRDKGNITTQNEWEYTFVQDYSLEEVMNSPHVMSDGLFYAIIDPQGKNHKYPDIVRKQNRLINKYIKIRPDILEKQNDDVIKYKTLGVHCRRSDLHIGHPNIALCYTNEQYLEKILKIYNEGGFEKIYIATEETNLIDFFKEKIPDKIIYQDCYRIPTEGSTCDYIGRYMHGTLACQEVLLDALNMSRCNSLLCSISGVSNATIYINGLQFENVYYFDEI